MAGAVQFRITGSEFVIPVDAVIRAIGQSRYVGLIEQFGIEHDDGVVTLEVIPTNIE